MKLETLAVHAGHIADETAGSIAPPIYLSTTFERSTDGDYPRGYHYSRSGNPNREAFERLLAGLEGGECALAFSSGSAATAALIGAFGPGDHLVLSSDVYYGTRKVVREYFERWGLQTSIVDFTSVDALRAAMRPNTRLVWAETPSNPLMRIVDIESIVSIAHEAGALAAFDNTFATPALQRPLEFGADIVMHSATKYLGGHSDVLLGALVMRRAGDLLERVRDVQRSVGGVPSPFECWLAMRGVATLPCRMRAHCEGAAAVAAFLDGHERVIATHYPGLPSHPGHQTARRQMSGFGGMVSFQVPGGADEALDVVARAGLFLRATSLGGVHSLIEHRASMEAPGTTTPANLIRISVGLEHPDDLLADLDRALA